MTDKEIRALIEKRRKEWRYGSSTEAKYKVEECDDILELLDSIQEEPVSNDLEEAAKNVGQKYFPDEDNIWARPNYEAVKVECAFKAGAKWQEEHLWKPADGDDLPEYEREVVVFTQNFPDDAGIMMVAIGHRPTPEGYDGKSLTTGEVEHYTPKTYDKGGWNIPDVKYWLDCLMPKEIEL